MRRLLTDEMLQYLKDNTAGITFQETNVVLFTASTLNLLKSPLFYSILMNERVTD